MRYAFGPNPWVFLWVGAVCLSGNVWAGDASRPTPVPAVVESRDATPADDAVVTTKDRDVAKSADGTIIAVESEKSAAKDEDSVQTAVEPVSEPMNEEVEPSPVPSTRLVKELIDPKLLALYKAYQSQLSISTTAGATAAGGNFPALLNFSDGLHDEIPSLQSNDLIDWVDGGKWPVNWTGVIIRAMCDIRDWDPDQKYVQGAVPGYLVRCVMPDSPASRAGLMAGDILLEMESDSGETATVNGFSWWQWMRVMPRNASEKKSGAIVRFLRQGELLQTKLCPASVFELPIFPHVWGRPSMPLGRLTIGIRPDGVVENVYVFWRPNGMASFMLFWQDPTKPASASMSVLEPNGGMYQVLKTEDLKAIPPVYLDYATYLWKDGQAEPAKIWVSSSRSGKSQSISYAKYAREQGINVEWVERLAKAEGIELPPIRKSNPDAERPFPRNNGQGPGRMGGEMGMGRGPEMNGPLGRGPEMDGPMGRGLDGQGMAPVREGMGMGRRTDDGPEGNPWEAMTSRPIPSEASDGTDIDKSEPNQGTPFTLPFPPQEGDQRDGRGRNRGNNPWAGGGPNSGNKWTMSVMNPEMDALRTELRELRESVQQLQQTIVELNAKLDALKK